MWWGGGACTALGWSGGNTAHPKTAPYPTLSPRHFLEWVSKEGRAKRGVGGRGPIDRALGWGPRAGLSPRPLLAPLGRAFCGFTKNCQGENLPYPRAV